MATLIPRAPLPTATAGGIPSVRNEARIDNRVQQQAIREVVSGAGELAQQWQDRNDTAALLKARRELSDWETNAFDPSSAEGISKYRGGNALNARTELSPKMDERIGAIREGLTPGQRARFDAIAGQWRDDVSTRLNNHMDREHSQYLENEEESSIATITQDAVLAGGAGDFERQDQVANEVITMRQRQLAAKGYAPESATSRRIVFDLGSSIRAQTVAGMVSSRPIEAAAYFDKHMGQMTPADRLRTEALVRPVLDDVQGDRDAQWAMNGGVDLPPADVAVSRRGEPAADIAKILDEEADAAGIDRADLYALAEQESGFNPKAKNPEALDDGDQAEGLFQYRKTSAGGIDRSDARASARRAAQEFASRSKKGGRQYAIAAHFAGEGGAEAVVQRGKTAENPKTARYVREVEARSQAWRGGEAKFIAPAATEADALERAQSITDPGRRQTAMRKIRENWSIRETRERESDKALSEQVYTTIQQNPNVPLRQSLGAQTYAKYEREGRIDGLETLRKNAIERTFVQDNPTLAEALYRESVLSPNTFAQRNLYENANDLSTQTLQDLLKRQASTSDPAARADWATEAQRIDSGLTQLGLSSNQDTKANKDSRDKQRDAFAIIYRNAEKAFIQSNGGKRPTPQQADALLASVVQGVAAAPDRLTKTLTVGLSAGAPAAAALDVATSQLTPAMRREAIQQYQARPGFAGRIPSDADIVRYWLRKGVQ